MQYFFPPEKLAVYEIIWKNIVESESNRWQYNTAHAHCALDKYRYRHTQNMWYLMLLSGNIGYANKRNRNAGTGGGGCRCVAVVLSLMPENYEVWGSIGPRFTSWAITVWYPVCTFALPPSLYWLRDLQVLGVERPGARNWLQYVAECSQLYFRASANLLHDMLLDCTFWQVTNSAE